MFVNLRQLLAINNYEYKDEDNFYTNINHIASIKLIKINDNYKICIYGINNKLLDEIYLSNKDEDEAFYAVHDLHIELNKEENFKITLDNEPSSYN